MARVLATATFTIATLVATSAGLSAVFEKRASDDYAVKMRDATPVMAETYRKDRDDARNKMHIYSNVAFASALLAAYSGLRAIKTRE